MTRPDDDNDDNDPGLDSELRDLIDAERRRPAPPPGTASRVQAAVLATVAATAASTAAASTAAASTAVAATTATTSALSGSTFGTGAIVAAALAATVAGTVFVATTDVDPPPPTVVETIVAPTRPAPPAGLILDVPAPVTTPAVTAVPTPPTAAPKKPIVVEAAPTPAEEAAILAAERQVLAEARQALAHDDIDGALGHLQRHRDTWARGHLVEEREALEVLALARGRRVEAGDAAARFRATWPHSIFLDAIDRALR